MKKNALLSAVITLSLLGLSHTTLSPSASASTQPLESGPGQLASQPSEESQSIVSEPTGSEPAGSEAVDSQPVFNDTMAVIVAFPSPVEFNIEDAQPQSITLILAQPLVTSLGEIIAPVNSPVQATLIPTDEGAHVQVNAVVTGGQILPVQAISSVLPFEKITSTEGRRAGRGARLWGKRGLALGCVFDSCSADNQALGGSIGAFVGSFSGENNSDTQKIVSIDQGSLHILQVQSH